MSPRGVANPDVRGRLLRAAERVLLRDGPDALTARSVTKEAGCATGVLYTHFSDLEEFLAEVVREHWQRVAANVADLPERAGTAAVVDNLAEAAAGLLAAQVFATMRLVLARPAVMSRMMVDGPTRPDPPLGQVEEAITRYLEAERRLGRVGPAADPGAAATLLVGALFHLIMHRSDARPDSVAQPELIRRVVAALETGLAP